jgi:RimJ/RimL family protein N-acetyltransferase
MQGRRIFDEREFHQAWIAWTGDTMGAKFIVESRGRRVGLVFEYNRSLDDGYSKATTLLEEESVGHGAGVVATVLLVDWLFKALPLRKVYLEVYGYNARVAEILRKFGLAEEGVLKEARFWDGSFWDVHIFAACRDAWPVLRSQVIRPMRRPAANGQSQKRKEVTGD